MAITYHFDLYPRDDPRDGARVVRFTKLQSAEYRGEANGTGSGRFTIRADETEAGNIDPRGLQYVRVVRDNGSTEKVIGGFWLETGDFSMLDEHTTRLLSFGGAGTLAYLSRAVMAPHTYIHDVFTGQDPFDDTWRLYAQSTIFANGNFLGAMLWRVIYEAQHFRSGSSTYTHRHGDGTEVTDNHSDDRTESAIADLVMDFTAFLDTDGAAWDQSSGEFKAQVGENVLAVVQRLMQAGLYVWMDPDTFELKAWQADDHRRNRTGTAWGSSVVYFTRPTGDDKTTGNILDAAKRAIHAYIKRRTLWVGGQDTYSKTVGTTDIPWEGHYYSDTNDTDALAQIGSVQSGARDDAGDVLQIPQTVQSSTPTSGKYLPFEDVLLDDLVTVKTGTGQFDLEDQNFPVAAITLHLRVGGDWGVLYDLGSAYTTTSSRQFQVAPVPAHNHPPNPRLCDPSTPCEALTAGQLMAAVAENGDAEDTGGGQWSGGAYQTARFHAGSRSYGDLSGTSHAITYTFDPAQVFTAGVRYVLDIMGSSLNVTAHAGSFGVEGVDAVTDAHTFPTVVIGADGNEWLLTRRCWTPSVDRTGVTLILEGTGTDGHYVVDDLTLYTAPSGLNGTSPRAARCDSPWLHVAAHEDRTDPHPVYATDADLAAHAATSHGGDITSALTEGGFLYAIHKDTGGSGEPLHLLTSEDGTTFTDYYGTSLPGIGTGLRDPSLIRFDGAWWIIATGGTADVFHVYRLLDGETDWTDHATITAVSGATQVWAPEWVRNMDGTPYLHPSTGLPVAMVAISMDGTTTFNIRELHPTNRGMTVWSAATNVTGTSFPKMIDPFCLVDGDTFYLWFKDEDAKHIEYATSDALTSGYTITESGDWASWSANKDAGANSIEGQALVRLPDGRWRIYINENNGFNSIRVVYSDSFDDWATWTTQQEIVTPELMGHGSVTFIPGMVDHQRDPGAHAGILDSLVTDHGDLAGLLDDDHTQYLNGARHAALDHDALVTTLIPVDTGTPTIDNGDPFGVTVTSVWGIDPDDDTPYYDDAGAAAGEEAALFYDPATDNYVLIAFDFTE